MIPYGRQEILQADIDAVVDVLHSDFITQGDAVPLFEKRVSDFVGAKYGVAVNSATSALHVACLALGLGRNDWLWVSPISFVASSNCGLYCGANVDFVDIEEESFNICPKKLEEKLLIAQKKDCLPKVVVAVHLCGQSAEMKRIFELSLQFGFKIIEDASHAVGGKYLGEYVGKCRYSAITVFSFHPVKIITTGEGGMALTNDAGLAEKMRLLRSHGITRDEAKMLSEPDGPWYYEQIELGFNYRMTDIHAALGLSQLNRLENYIERRNAIAKYYNSALQQLPLKLPLVNGNCYSTYHLYVIRLQLKKIDLSQREVFEILRSKGIGVNIHYIPIFQHPYYRKFKLKIDEFSNTLKYYNEAITLPIFPSMTKDEQQKVVSALSDVLKR